MMTTSPMYYFFLIFMVNNILNFCLFIPNTVAEFGASLDDNLLLLVNSVVDDHCANAFAVLFSHLFCHDL
jgi:hypothetical protein